MLCFFYACSFDEDVAYLPHTKVKYLVYEDTNLLGTHVLRIEGENLEKNWEEKWGLSSSDLGDIRGYQQELWISDANNREVLEVDPTTGLVKRRQKLSSIQPHYLCVGEQAVLISDTIQNLLGFWDKRKNELKQYKLKYQPLFAAYRSQKFFIAYDQTKILIYHEKALIPIDSLDFFYPIEDLQIDNGLYTIVFGLDDAQRYQGLIDYNTNAFIEPPQATSIIKARYSPFNRQVYGREFLVDHILKEDRRISFIQNIQDFEVDFFEGNMYFLRNDSLSVFNHWTKKTDNILSFQGKFKSAYFYID